MRKVVTGRIGFMGSHIVEAYLAQGHHVAVVDNHWPYGGSRRKNIFPAVRRSIVDITDSTLTEAFECERPDVVCHHAAQHSARISAEVPALDAHRNILGLLNIHDGAHERVPEPEAQVYQALTSHVAAGPPSTQRITLETTADAPTL